MATCVQPVVIGANCLQPTVVGVTCLQPGPAPAILVQPVPVSIFAATTAVFFVVALEIHEITYQWQVSTDNGLTWNNVVDGVNYSGAQQDTLSVLLTPLSFDNYLYRCAVGSLTWPAVLSNSAELTVISPYEGVVNWTVSPAAAAKLWYDIAWSPSLSLFAAIHLSSSANGIMTSPDGITWTLRAPPTVGSPFWTSITWGPTVGLFVAVAGTGGVNNCVMTSPDGITWTQRTASLSVGWNRVRWIPTLNKFLVGARTGGAYTMTSPNGVNWTTVITPNNLQVYGIAWSPALGKAVMVGSAAPYILYSSDLVTWSPAVITGARNSGDVAWSDALGMFVTVCTADAPNNVKIFARSTDGINWTQYDPNFPSSGTAAYSAIQWSAPLAVFVAVGYNPTSGKAIISSKDGINWTERTSPEPTNTWSGLAWSTELGKFCVVAQTGTNRTMLSQPSP